MQRLIFVVLTAFILSLAAGPIIIPMLHRLRFGQNVRSDGPQSHLKKQGVPTMGGIMIMLTMLASALVFSFAPGRLSVMAPCVVFIAANAFIGLIDDYIKVVKKRSLGLRARHKILFSLIVSLAFSLYCYISPEISTAIYIPFVSTFVDIGIWYIPLMVFVIIATTNSANLLDGADGLLSGVTLVIAVTLSIIMAYMPSFTVGGVSGNMMVLSGALVGSCLGFLRFNHYPARIIMGDVGSFGLGATVVAICMISGLTLIIPLIAIMYVVSAVSDIIQIGYFKMSGGKRVFKMAPFHHHLELTGMKETKIVALYMGITVVACALALFLLN